VRALNLYDILGRRIIGSSSGTSNDMPTGALSAANSANPNFLGVRRDVLLSRELPGPIPPAVLAELRSALTVGTTSRCGAPRLQDRNGHADRSAPEPELDHRFDVGPRP
jgi:hypothetical protein